MSKKIAIIGLGYVGLPLAVEFGKKYTTVGFDINEERISELNSGHDSTKEVSDEKLSAVLTSTENSKGLLISKDMSAIADCDVYIVTVPTPVDNHNKPDLTPIRKASETVTKVLSKDNIVIYESTVYPGVTEDECVPILEKSGLTFNRDFYVGYSPERINPGDKKHTVSKIMKVTSGSTPEIATIVDELYNTVIEAGTFKATSIKVAEAAKVIENSQRDINIAFVNELARIFSLMGIDTTEVLEAAGSKWNFLPFRPGLVGGHCIGVDPYYLAQKAEEYGYHPEIILAGRRMNDGMGKWVVSEIVKLMIQKKIIVSTAKVLVLGITFKENCPDIRNTKAIDLINEFKSYGCTVNVHDPIAYPEEVKDEYGIELQSEVNIEEYDTIVLAVAHAEYSSLTVPVNHPNKVVYDVKSFLPKESVDGRL